MFKCSYLSMAEQTRRETSDVAFCSRSLLQAASRPPPPHASSLPPVACLTRLAVVVASAFSSFPSTFSPRAAHCEERREPRKVSGSGSEHTSERLRLSHADRCHRPLVAPLQSAWLPLGEADLCSPQSPPLPALGLPSAAPRRCGSELVAARLDLVGRQLHGEIAVRRRRVASRETRDQLVLARTRLSS